MKTCLALVLVLAAGCKKDTTAGATKTGDCATVLTAAIDHVAHSGIDEGAKNGAPAAEVERIKKDLDASLGPLKKATIQACTEDHWSAEALTCIATKQKLEECADKLTDAQNKHVEQLVTAATKKTGSPACEKYAKMEMECGGAPEDAKPTIIDFCTKAEGGATDTTYQLIALETGCAQTAADCDAYKKCVDDKKATTTPK
ncbi:MAG TPA: hypothetical protein VFQ65_11950 [Kofleriaceae bacterium]|nr:hypothetical protein [Kofleriaceae bacterium]